MNPASIFLVALLAAVLVAALVVDRQGRRSRLPLAIAALVLSVLFVSYLTLPPPNGSRSSTLSVIPFIDTARSLADPITSSHAAGGVIADVLLFFPFGAALAAIHRPGRGNVAPLCYALALSVCVEVAQFLINRGSVAAVDDVITNTVGALIGWTAYRRLSRTHSSAEPAADPGSGSALA